MYVRQLVAIAVLLSAGASAQISHRSFDPSMPENCTVVAAQVVTSNGLPAPGATLDITDPDGGNPLAADVAQNSSDVACLPAGHYRFTATTNTGQVSEDVLVGGPTQSIILRVPGQSSGTSAAAVSVTELQVPNKARKALERAKDKLRHNNYAAAFKATDEAIALDANYGEAYRIRGLVKLVQRRVGEAIDDLGTAVKLNGGDSVARIMLGAAFNATQKFSDAARTIEAALPFASNQWQAYFELGKAYAGLGRIPESLQSLNRAVELNPTFAPIRYVRGTVLMHAGQREQALRDLEQYVKDSPNTPEAAAAREMITGSD